MSQAATAEHFLESYRSTMIMLARMHLDRRLWARIDPEDMVQQTCLEAVAGWDKFRGSTEQERKSWVRQILLMSSPAICKRKKKDILESFHKSPPSLVGYHRTVGRDNSGGAL